MTSDASGCRRTGLQARSPNWSQLLPTALERELVMLESESLVLFVDGPGDPSYGRVVDQPDASAIVSWQGSHDSEAIGIELFVWLRSALTRRAHVANRATRSTATNGSLDSIMRT